jgi:hypothetical protein
MDCMRKKIAFFDLFKKKGVWQIKLLLTCFAVPAVHCLRRCLYVALHSHITTCWGCHQLIRNLDHGVNWKIQYCKNASFYS